MKKILLAMAFAMVSTASHADTYTEVFKSFDVFLETISERLYGDFSDIDVPTPTVEMQDLEELRGSYERLCAGMCDGAEVLAYYDTTRAAIVLSTDFDLSLVEHQGWLLHEYVHHVQFMDGHTFPCANAVEADAYTAEVIYLDAFGDMDEEYLGDLFFHGMSLSQC